MKSAGSPRVLLGALFLLGQLGMGEAFCRKAAAQRPLDIPFSQENGFLIVEVLLNEVFPVRMIFDTGSEYTLLTDPITFPMLQPDGAEPIRLVGSDLSTSVLGLLSRRNRLQIGDVNISAQPIIAVETPYFNASEIAGPNIYGLLGIGGFGAYIIEIDYAREMIRLTPPPRYRPLGGAVALPISVDHGKAYVKLMTKVHERFVDSLNFLLDSGAALEMLVYATPQDSAIYPPSLIAGSIGYGLGGELLGYVGRTDSLYVGDLRLTGVVTHFQVDAMHSLQASIVARHGIIGNRLLSRFHVAIDLPGETLYLTPRRGYRKPRSYDRSGLRVVRDGTANNLLRIQYVAPSTPAAEAGLIAGDRILNLNRRPASTFTLEGFQRKLRGKPGRRIRLRYQRDGVMGHATFTLRELI